MFLKKRKKKSSFATPKIADLPKRPRRRKFHLRWKLWLPIVFFILFLAGAVYFVFFSSVFKIKAIKISGQRLVPPEQIEAIIKNKLDSKFLNFFSRDAILPLWYPDLKTEILDSFLEIESVEFKKINLGQLEAVVAERKAAAVLCLIEKTSQLSQSPAAAGDAFAGAASTSAPVEKKEAQFQAKQCFFIDEQGLVYRPAPQLSATTLPTFYTERAQSCEFKTQAVSGALIQFAVQTKNELRKLMIDLVGFSLSSQNESELEAVTDEGWLIYFDASQAAAKQIKSLGVVLSEKIKDRAGLQYIDLRVENRVYYK